MAIEIVDLFKKWWIFPYVAFYQRIELMYLGKPRIVVWKVVTTEFLFFLDMLFAKAAKLQYFLLGNYWT